MPLMSVTTADRFEESDVYRREVAVLRSLVGISVGTGSALQSSNRSSRAWSRSVTAGSGANAAHRWVTAPWTRAAAAISPAATANVGVLSMVSLESRLPYSPRLAGGRGAKTRRKRPDEDPA